MAALGNGHKSEIVTPVTPDASAAQDGGDVAAAAPLRNAPSERAPVRRTPLRLVPPLRRRRRRSYGDALFATTLSVVLAVGIVGVLLLNTSMQTQADQIQAMRQRVAALSLQEQQDQTSLDRDNSPSALAARAVALNMRPARNVTILRPADLRAAQPRPAQPRVTPIGARHLAPGHRVKPKTRSKVSARGRAVRSTHAG